jgi:hypothetical protein
MVTNARVAVADGLAHVCQAIDYDHLDAATLAMAIELVNSIEHTLADIDRALWQLET